MSRLCRRLIVWLIIGSRRFGLIHVFIPSVTHSVLLPFRVVREVRFPDRGRSCSLNLALDRSRRASHDWGWGLRPGDRLHMGDSSRLEELPMGIAVHDLSSSSIKPVFVPLIASTSLPTLCTDIAELCAAFALGNYHQQWKVVQR